MTAMQDDDQAQLNGAVHVFYYYPLKDTDENGNEVPRRHTNLLDPSFAEIVAKCGPMLNDLPIRFTGVHMCYENSQLNPLVNMIHVLIGRENRLRFRSHQGSQMESQYALMQFGIPLKVAPVFQTTSELRVYNREYLDRRRQVESKSVQLEGGVGNTTSANTLNVGNSIDSADDAKDQQQQQQQKVSDSITSSSEPELIACPNEYDVLLGRGRPYQDFSGNQYLIKLVDVIRNCYTGTNDRQEKRYLAMSVLAQIESKGGRFLKRIGPRSTSEADADAVADVDVDVDVDADADAEEHQDQEVSATVGSIELNEKSTPTDGVGDDGDGVLLSSDSNDHGFRHENKSEKEKASESFTATTTLKKGWQVVSSDIALDKILHAFRTKKGGSGGGGADTTITTTSTT
jgi:hypothetical protein